MHGQAVEYQGIPQPIVRGYPIAGHLIYVHRHAPKPPREMELVHSSLVRAGPHCQTAMLPRTVAQRYPAGVGVGCTLDRNEVLMRRCAEGRVLGENEPADLHRVH